jgi:hypothetical protein
MKAIQKHGFNPSELDYNLAAFAYLKANLFSNTVDVNFNEFFGLLYRMKVLGYRLHSATVDFDPFDLSILEGLRNVFGGIKMAMTTLENNDKPSAEISIKNFSISQSLKNRDDIILSELSSKIDLNSNIQSLNIPSTHTPLNTNVLDSLERTEEVLTYHESLLSIDQINVNNGSNYDVDIKDENVYGNLRNIVSPTTLIESPSSKNVIINTTKYNENEKNTKNVQNSRIWIPSNPKSITKNIADESDDMKDKKNKKSVSWPLKSNSFSTGSEFYVDNDVYNDISNIENNIIESDVGNDDYNYEIQDDNDEGSLDNIYDNDKDMILMSAADVNVSPDEMTHMNLMDRLQLFPRKNDADTSRGGSRKYTDSDPEYYDEEVDVIDESEYEESSVFSLGLSPSGQGGGLGTRRRRMGRSREPTSSNLDALLSLSNLNSYNISKVGLTDNVLTPLLVSKYSPSPKETLSTTQKDSDPLQGLESARGKIVNGNLSSTEVATESTNALSEETKRANLKLNMRRIEQIELLTSKRKDRS